MRRLVADGWRVRASARSDRAARTVAASGAEPVRGELGDTASLVAGATGADVVFHCAAYVEQWGTPEVYLRTNVTGTRNVIAACRTAGVPRMVHVGSEAAMLAGDPLHDIDEDTPLRPDSVSLYCATKAMAELEVRQANDDGLRTVVVRPRLVWGPGDATVLPALVDAVRRGRFRWIGSGRHATSTTHVDNAVHGLVLAATAPDPGPTYFVTDGPPVEFREFVTDLLATAGVTAPKKHLSPRVATPVAAAGEWLWRAFSLPGAPPLTRTALWLSSLECTVDIGRAERELGYRPVVSRSEGLARLGAR